MGDLNVVTSKERRQLLERAETIASKLWRAEVRQNQLRAIANVLFLPARPWPDRLEQAKKLLDLLPGSWVNRRSKKAPGQLMALKNALVPVLQQNSDEEVLRFVLGWASRFLKIIETEDKRSGRRTENDETG